MMKEPVAKKEPSVIERTVERIVNKYPLDNWIVIGLLIITIGVLIATGIRAFS